uniref:Rieske domain-containing protein-like n=1 Tax=Salmo trutta TaxID=8032 RepID=A0A673ZGS6_SALTR
MFISLSQECIYIWKLSTCSLRKSRHPLHPPLHRHLHPPTSSGGKKTLSRPSVSPSWWAGGMCWFSATRASYTPWTCAATEFDGRMCIVCPWHKYKITLAEGEGLYQAVNPSATPPKPTWRSKGVKQRVHQVTEVNRDVYVTFNDSPDTIDSDFYQTERYRATMNKAQPKTKKLQEKVTSRKV